MKRTLLFMGLLLATGGAAGYAPAPDAPTSPSVGAAPDRHLRTCRGGDESRVELEIVPDRVIAGPRGEAMDLSLRLASRFPGAARLRYGIELVDDRGNALRAPSLSPLIRWSRKGEETWAKVNVPADLPDGFYQLRATAAARGGSEEAAGTVQLYLQKENGALRQLDTEEWLATSRENVAVES